MYKAKITNIERVRHQANNSEFLDVSFDIIDEEGKIKISKRIGLDMNCTKEEVIKEVNNHIEEHKREVEIKKIEKEKEKVDKNFKDIKDSLVAKELKGIDDEDD